jgi:hypothetical protein
MASLEASIRRLTGASVVAASVDDVAAALAANRVRHVGVPVAWERAIDGEGVRTYLRGRVPSWGAFEPTTQATAAAQAVTVTHSDGSAITGTWTLDQDGTIVFAVDQAAARRVVVSAYSYDVSAACAYVVDQLVAVCAGDYTVKLGDQTFNRGEGAMGLRALAARFRAGALPVTVALERLDEEPAPRRRRTRRSC